MGHASSLAQRVLERLDAELAETDDAGRPILAGKVAAVCVVGNEDGAHKAIADLFQDLGEAPEATASATATLARNAAHLARALRASPYPAP